MLEYDLGRTRTCTRGLSTRTQGVSTRIFSALSLAYTMVLVLVLVLIPILEKVGTCPTLDRILTMKRIAKWPIFLIT